eukprot:CAMPEP_0196738314 /NCGR_PEP_ID=MMETSP1091-20130531/15743_1 /TAXON_ID=302021 /ORGANISM="Rhodomonas sp., Strain CCMP768" /LENGTH=452 /DNA_ID=CAMNT_0042082275 /DNA_START=16 /DNA_END=1374 /DNA_ORIENTATION=-
MAEASFWDPFGILGAFFGPDQDIPSHVQAAGSRMVTDGNESAKPRKKKLYFGGESMVPDDYVPPPPTHPIVFDGKIKGRELHVRNFYRHFACYSPSVLNDTIVDRLETLGEYKKPAWYNGVLASCTPTLVEHDVEYDREALDDDDGGVICIDWAHPSRHDETTPIVLIFPGLAGHSGKDYIRSVAKKVVTSLGWRVCVLNWRGFNSPLASAKVFRPDDISDMETVINVAGSRYPVAPLYGVGFSAGSNQLVKYLGKSKKFSRLCAAVSVCNGFEYSSHLNRLEASSMGKGFYSRGMTFLHQEYLKKHGKDLEKKVPGFDLNRALAATSHSDLDEALVQSLYGFEEISDYYEAVASRPYIPSVEVPLLCIQAADDPLFTEGEEPSKCWETLPVDELHDNTNIVYFETELGSHLNFVEANRPEGVIRADFSFSDRAIATFFDTVKDQAPRRIMF